MHSAVLLLLVTGLPGLMAAPTSPGQSAAPEDPVSSVTGWNGQYSMESDGADVFIGLGGYPPEPTSMQRKKYHTRPTTTTAAGSDDDTGTTTEESEKVITFWSVSWYLALLAAFIVFFVFIGLMEVCCRRRGRFSYCWGPDPTSRGSVTPRLDSTSSSRMGDPNNAPPPPYALFKPPSYNTLFPSNDATVPEKVLGSTVESPPAEQLIYVINVHGGRGVS